MNKEYIMSGLNNMGSIAAIIAAVPIIYKWWLKIKVKFRNLKRKYLTKISKDRLFGDGHGEHSVFNYDIGKMKFSKNVKHSIETLFSYFASGEAVNTSDHSLTKQANDTINYVWSNLSGLDKYKLNYIFICGFDQQNKSVKLLSRKYT